MMSGHNANSIFFNKKIKIGRPEHLLTPTPTSDNISFCLTSPPPIKVDVISVSLLMCWKNEIPVSLEAAIRRCSSK